MLRLAELITIVIPCKNEELYVGKLLEDLDNQRGSDGMRVIVADGGSTDRTPGAIKARQLTCKKIMICVAEGGSVSRGRNEGLNATTTPYVAFIDADTRLFNKNILIEAVRELRKGTLMVGAPIKCYRGDWRAHMGFKLFNLIHKYYIKMETFCVGQFCVISTQKAKEIGGFDETLMHSEDFIFSRKIPVGSFKLLKSYTGQDDRRFKKMGYMSFTWMMLRNFIFRNRIERFRKDIKYWQ
jgi:glycosyltransferase involved in cell wall biosynthesis